MPLPIIIIIPWTNEKQAFVQYFIYSCELSLLILKEMSYNFFGSRRRDFEKERNF